jgi:hypothetical protein
VNASIVEARPNTTSRVTQLDALRSAAVADISGTIGAFERTPGMASSGRGVQLNAMEKPQMRLEGIHHIRSITADAQPNVNFYAGVLGLRRARPKRGMSDPSCTGR